MVAGKAGLTPGQQLENARWRKHVINLLVANAAEVEAEGRGDKRFFRVGTLVAEFESPMPRAEWEALYTAEPPRSDESRTIAGVQSYIKRLSDVVIADADRAPTFRRAIRTLGTRIGDTRMAALDNEVKRSLVLIGEPAARTERARGEAASGGKVTVQVGSVAVSFDSPISQADWNKALDLRPPPENVDTGRALIRYLQRLASLMASNDRFRETLPTAVAWFGRFTSDMPSYARQAITCGGTTLTTVTIRGNKVFGFLRGVHVGVSRNDPKMIRAGTVSIADNHLSLRKPGDDVYVSMGLFVGNVDTLRIQRNTLDWAGRGARTPIQHGIRVWGRHRHLSQDRRQSHFGRPDRHRGAADSRIRKYQPFPVGRVGQSGRECVLEQCDPGAGVSVAPRQSALKFSPDFTNFLEISARIGHVTLGLD